MGWPSVMLPAMIGVLFTPEEQQVHKAEAMIHSG